MMDKYIKDLSKPVGFVGLKNIISLAEGHLGVISPNAVFGEVPVYSQEYVNALIAQLEAAQKDSDGLREKVNQVDSEWHKMADRILSAGKRAEKAEAALSAANEKLSKPVVLPPRIENIELRQPLEVEDMWRHRFIAAIKAAGFTVAAE
ncbi:hypothetical protein JE944_003113 [Yersinia ruckeri]|nr:hypothetical protein [Yersinia ruckeri]